MIVAQLIVSILLPWCLGYTAVALLFRKNPLPFLVGAALGYGVGMGLLTQWMLLLGILKIPWTLRSTVFPLALGCFLFLLYLKNRKIHPPTDYSKQHQQNTRDPIAIFLLLYIFYMTIYVFWRSFNVPVVNWDEIATISFQAKIFFHENSILLLKNLPRASYPIHVPLMEAWVALNLHKWDDQLIKAVFPFTYLSYLIIHFWFLNQYTNKRWALFGVGLLVSANLFTSHAANAYRDFFLLYYNCTTVILLILWYKKRWDALLLLASLFAGFATFTKMEGIFYLAINSCLLLLVLKTRGDLSARSKLLKFFYFALPSYLIWGFYAGYRMMAHIPMDSGAGIVTLNCIQRIPVFLHKIALDLFFTGNWNIIWFLLVISLLRSAKRTMEASWILIVLVMHFSVIAFLSILTRAHLGLLGEQWWTVLPRLILHAYPLAVLLIILLNAPASSKEAKQP